MATDDDGRNPFTRPGFIAAAVVIALVVALGVVLVIVNSNDKDDPGPTPTSLATTSAAPTTDTTTAEGGESVCGLDGTDLETAQLTTAPAVDEWAFQGTAAYPTAEDFGPAAVDPAGFRYCFQHTPEGALFAAAYASIVSTDPTVVPEWIKYFTAPGPYRDQLIQTSAGSGETGDIRLRIAGFRVLAYDGTTARVDVALASSVDGQSLTLSAVYPLVWSDGDWKVSTDTPEPGSVASIPDLVGYIPWGQ